MNMEVSLLKVKKIMDYKNEIKYKRAQERVTAIKGFYSSLLAYCIIIPFLTLFNHKTSHFPWVIFPALGWGLGLLGHWSNAFGYHPFLGKDWENRKIEEYMKNEDF